MLILDHGVKGGVCSTEFNRVVLMVQHSIVKVAALLEERILVLQNI